MLELYNYAKISKTAFRAITSINTEYIVKYEEKVQINESTCGACPLYESYKKLSELKELYQTESLMYREELNDIHNQLSQLKTQCKHFCDKAIIKKEYNNDDNKYHLYGKKYRNKRVPKASVKLFLLLHLLPNSGQKGHYIIKDVNTLHIAEFLCCNQKTVEKSLHILEALEYITISNASDHHHFNIIVNSMVTQYETADRGGSGYITLSQDIIKDLLTEGNINKLRFNLLKLLKVDDNTRTGESVKSVEWSLKDIKHRLPSHLGCRSKIGILLSKEDKLFEQQLCDNKLIFKTKEIHLKDESKQYVNRNMAEIETMLVSQCIEQVSEHDIQDLASITLQYSLERISNALDIYNKARKNTIISSMGAFIRQICYNQSCASLV